MNVNDLHPKFQLDITDTNKSPDKEYINTDWNDLVLGLGSGVPYASINVPDMPTKTGAIFEPATGYITISQPTESRDAFPSSFLTEIQFHSVAGIQVKSIRFTYENGSIDYWYDGDYLNFSHVSGTDKYYTADAGWRTAKKVELILSVPGMWVDTPYEIPKDTTWVTTSMTPSNRHKILYFNYYPSGFLIRAFVEGGSDTHFTCNLYRHYFSYSGSSGKVTTVQFLSPIPKTYCFFAVNSTESDLWVLTSNSWTYSNDLHLWYRAAWCLSDGHGHYNFGYGISDTFFNKMFFIDPLLWDYKDQKTVNEDQTENDVALYPIYKIDGTDTYGINNINLSGTYNFLTSYGALYQYPGNLNRLKEGYVTTHAKSNSQFNVSQTKSTTSEIDNRGVIPTFDAELHYQYGSIINKAILKDNGFKENNDRFRNNDNVNVIQDNQQGKCLYWSRAQEPSLLWLDEYHLWLMDKQVFRIPIGYNVALLKRTPSNVDTSKVPQQGVSTNFDYAYTGFNLSLALSTRDVEVSFHYGECNDYISGEYEIGSPYSQSYFKTNYSYTQQILNRNTNQWENDSVSSWWNTNTDQITRKYQYNIFFNGYHIVSQRESTLVRVGDYGLPHYNNTPFKEKVYYWFIFTTNNFYYPLYTTVTSNEDNIPIYSATQTYTDSYTSSYEQGWNARIVHDTDYLRVINYYYKKNSPTKVWAGLLFHARQDPDLIPNFAYNLINPNLAQWVTLKNDNGDDVSEYVGAASVSGSKVAAVTMDIDATGSRSTWYVCIKPN